MKRDGWNKVLQDNAELEVLTAKKEIFHTP